ncbi:MAG: hypothetical protein ACLVC6_01700 [Alistipes ihumii]|jgi:hypothetical protein|uniref:hypothetical protein n=1 Tax=Alistipes ihumii TaxID=1470347 RepID=UPI0026733924|nr:hypothetical protein [Alistipes ihumii]
MERIWINYSPELAAVGKKVLGFPDHRGYSALGIIRAVMPNGLWVEYEGLGPVLLDRAGKFSEGIDCNRDINLVEK